MDIKDFIYNEKHILYIFIHKSSEAHKTANKIYDRNEDGDFDITNNTTLISNATMDDLRIDLIEQARKMALTYLKNQDLIINVGSDTKPVWRKK